MQVLTSVQAVRHACKALRQSAPERTIGLVPTMGALHDGHISLVRAARQSCDLTVVTVFVNPLQFGASEDLSKYPRTFEQDVAMLESEGVDLLFAPTADEMYPTPTQTWVDVPALGGRLDGGSRPGHFQGVATVVSKLFHIVQPDRAFFGQKDAAQVAVLRAMVRDLNFDLELVVCPTVRESDGLAMSSRNRYLSTEERATALALSRSLRRVEHAFADGQRSVSVLRDMLLDELHAASGIRVDYAEIVHPDTLEPLTEVHATTLVAVAAWVGTTRLIDNILLSVDGPKS